MMRNVDMHDHYSSGRIPAEIAENLKEFTEHDDLSYEEFLMQQESVYQSIQANGRNRGTASDYGHSSDWSQFSGQEGESSRGGSAMSQLGLDEALAKALQELEDGFDDINISEHSGTAVGSTEISPTETPAGASREDDVDPDNMSYEQLQSLGDSIGNENNGLSEELISKLPTFKYNNKVGLFSKKKKRENEECVICCMAFDNGERLIKLPCKHEYHSKCITRWLKLKKVLPHQSRVGTCMRGPRISPVTGKQNPVLHAHASPQSVIGSGVPHGTLGVSNSYVL